MLRVVERRQGHGAALDAAHDRLEDRHFLLHHSDSRARRSRHRLSLLDRQFKKAPMEASRQDMGGIRWQQPRVPVGQSRTDGPFPR